MKCASKTSKRRLQSPAAFTIVEVLVAFFVFAMVFGTAFSVIGQASKQLDTARAIAAAGAILQVQLEKERLLTWDEASDISYQPTIDTGFMSDPNIAGRFVLERVVTPMPGRETRMLQITLIARWRSLDGMELSRRLTTYYRQGGLYDYLTRSP